MTTESDRFRRLEDLYHAARAQPASARAEFLSRAAAGDEELHREVESLLAHEPQADAFLEPLLRSASASVEQGDVLGHYTILEFLGAGGMGEVYRARDPRLERDVAIKVLPRTTTDANGARRLLAEAQAAGALNHPNILTVYDIGTHEGSPFLVSELLRGETLRQQLARGPLGEAEAIELGLQIARGLAAAHDAGVVHRDLKPENVYVTGDRRVKILDFGIARRTALPASAAPAPATIPPATSRADATTVAGTAGYMAPEQRRGGRVDQRADVFAFGAMLHELLTGRRPDTTAETRELPRTLRPIVERCLQPEPDDRFQSAHDLLEALTACRDAGSRDRTSAIRRHPYVAASVLLAVLAVGGVVGRAWLASTRSVQPAKVGNPAANEAYVTGRFFLAKGTEPDIRKAIAYFDRAAASDPSAAGPYAGIADAYTALRSVYAAPHDVMPQAKAAAAKALERDPALAEAHVSMGSVLMFYDFDWAGAERELRRAIALRPDLAAAHQAYALLLAARGRAGEAAAAIDKARALDPLSLPILVDAGWVYYLGRDFDQMIAADRKAVELDASFWPAYRDLGLGFEKVNRLGDAVAVLEKARALDANSTVLEMLGGAYAAAGRRNAAEKVVADLATMAREHYVCPYEIATVHAGLGNTSEALDALEQGYAQRADCMPWAAADPKLDRLRHMPRFVSLMRRMGLAGE